MAETLTVSDAGSGQTTVTSTITASDVTFDNPTGTLTINAGDTNANTIDIDSLSADYSASIDINGGDAGDTVNVNAAVDLADDESLTIDAHTIALPNAASDVSTLGVGSVTLTATRNILLSDGSSVATASGGITLDANSSGTATGDFRGVEILGTVETTGSGNIDIDGIGGDANASNQHGVALEDNGIVRSTNATAGAGTITIDGRGGSGGGNNHYGIFIDDSSLISSAEGAITLTGNGNGSGNSNHGVLLSSGSVMASGNASVSITGNGATAAGGTTHRGIVMRHNSLVQTQDGTLMLTGTAGAPGGDGILLHDSDSGRVFSTGAGAITLTATGAGGADDLRAGANSIVGGASATGPVTINADTIGFSGSLNVQSTGDLVIQPRSTSTSIGLGDGSGTLNLDDTELGFLQNGFDSITIGDATSGDIDIDTATFNDPLTLATGGEVHDNGGTDINMAGGDAVTVDGTVAPGQSPGILNVTGDFVFDDGSTYEAELNGATAGTQHDQVNVTGSVTIGTNVTLDASVGYTPGSTDQLVIVTATSITGDFDELSNGDLIIIDDHPFTYVNTGSVIRLDYDATPDLTDDATAGNDDFFIQIDSGNVEVYAGTDDTGTLILSTPAANVATLTLDGTGGDDHFVIDYAAGMPNIVIDGGDNDDDLDIDANGADITIGLDNTTAESGSASVGGWSIDWSDIEPNTVAVSGAATLTVDISGSDTVDFQRDAAMGATVTRVVGSTNQVTFTTPTTQLVVNDLDNSAHNVTFTDFADDFDGTTPSAGLEYVDAGTDDIVDFPSALSLAAFDITAATINLDANLNTDGGDVELNGSVVIGAATVTIDTETGDDNTAGGVTITGSVSADAASRDFSIDTSSTGDTAGNVSLPTFNNTGGASIDDLSVTAEGGVANGNVSLTAAVTTTSTITIDQTTSVDIDGDVSGSVVTISNVTSDVDLAAGVDISSTAGNVDINNSVNRINLSGAATTNRIQATGGNVELSDVVDSGTPALLEISADDDITVANVTLDGNTTNTLDFFLDQDLGGATLTAGTLLAGSVSASGTGVDDTANFNGTVGATDSYLGNSVLVGLFDQVNLAADVTAAAGIVFQVINTEVQLATDVDITTTDGNVDFSNGVTLIDLAGTGTNIIAATDGANATSGNVLLANVTDSADVVELRITASDDVVIDNITLDNPAATTAGLVNIDIDGDNANDGVTFTYTSITGGSIDIDSNDSLTINNTITSTANGGSLDISVNESGGTEDLLITGTVTATGTSGDVTLSAGDNVTAQAGSAISAVDAITINGDAATDDAGGTTINLSGTITGVTLNVNGNTGDDVLQIVESTGNPLPSLTGDSTSAGLNRGAHSNAAFNNNVTAGSISGTDTNIGTHFEAGTGTDSIEFTYALAAYTVSYFSDDDAEPASDPNSGVVNVQGQMTLSFDGLAPMSHTSLITGGTLVVDATSTAATTFLTVNDTGGAADGTNIVTGDGGFEDTTFTGFANLIVRSGTGNETVTLIGADGATPAGGGSPLASIRLDGDNSLDGPAAGADSLGNDTGDDIIVVRSSPATINVEMLGGAGDDTFILDSDGDGALNAGTVDNILGTVEIAAANDEGGTDALFLVDTDDTDADTVVITNSTIDGITGEGTATADITYDAAGQILDEITIFTGNTAGDIVTVASTVAGSLYEIATQGGNDTVNITSDSTTLQSGNLNAVLGQVQIDTGAGDDALNISDYTAGVADTYDLTQIGPAGRTAVDFNGATLNDDVLYNVDILDFNDTNNTNLGFTATLEVFRVVGSEEGDNTYNINDTTGTETNTIDDGDATASTDSDATFNIQANQVEGGAQNTFNGFDGDDTFNVDLAADTSVPTAAGTTFVINGGAEAATTDNRDRVFIDASLDVGAARPLNFTYASNTSGDVDVDGLGSDPAGVGLDLNTVETVFYDGDVGNNDDVLTVTGTGNDDDLTFAPLELDELLVFLNGQPFENAPQDFTARIPGVGGGSTGPDLRIDGITSVSADAGAGTADQIYVYGTSDADLTTGTADVFGFGAGVIIPSATNAARPGGALADAFDAILVADDQVQIVDNLVAQTDIVVPIDIVTTNIVQGVATNPALIVNAGQEDNPTLTAGIDVADDISAALSTTIAIHVNGNNPDPALPTATPPGTGITPTDGDRLDVVTVNEINVRSDKATPPNVTIDTTGSLNLTFSSIENALLTPGPGSQTVNVYGDNNDSAVDQADNFVIVGANVDSSLAAIPGGHPDFNPDPDGDNEFILSINGSAPVQFRNVATLNVFGDDASGTASTGNDIDTLDITPYADSNGGWGLDVFFDEGNPVGADGDQADLLIYRTALNGGGVSEDIVYQPSGPEDGELRATNAADGTSIVTISVVNNLDIQVIDDDGHTSDTDTVTFRGTNPDTPTTSGNETVTVDWSAAGTGAAPIATINDGGTTLYRVQRTINFETVTFDLGAGTDSASVTGREAVDEVQLIDVAGNTAGDIQLTFDGQSTGDIALAATDATNATNIQMALEGLAAIGAGNVTVTTVAAGQYSAAFGGALAGQNVASIRITAGTTALTPGGGFALAASTTEDGGAVDTTILGSEALTFNGGNNQDDAYTVNLNDDGTVGVTAVLNASGVTNRFNLTGTDSITIDGGGGTGTDAVTLNGTTANENFTVAGTATLAGTITATGGPTILFASLGSTSSDLTVNGGGGDDFLEATHISDWQIDDVTFNGGSASNSFEFTGTTGTDDITFSTK